MKEFDFKRPNERATWKQRATLSRLTGNRSFFTDELTMQEASDQIQQHLKEKTVRLVQHKIPMTQEQEQTESQPHRQSQSQTLNDDITMDILVIVGDANGKPLSPQDIVSEFKVRNHRVDTATINRAINQTVNNPNYPLYGEIRESIVNRLIVPPKFGKPPNWYLLFHPPARVPAVISTLTPIQETGTKFDSALTEVNELLTKLESKPGNKKITRRLRDVVDIGVIAVGQEKDKTDQTLEQLQQQSRLIMERLGITYEKEPPDAIRPG